MESPRTPEEQYRQQKEIDTYNYYEWIINGITEHPEIEKINTTKEWLISQSNEINYLIDQKENPRNMASIFGLCLETQEASIAYACLKIILITLKRHRRENNDDEHVQRIRELYPELRDEMIRKWPLVRVQYAYEYIENHT